MADVAQVVPNGDTPKVNKFADGEATLDGLLRGAFSTVFSPGEAPVSHRVRIAFYENAPLVREASANSGKRVLRWTRRGTPLRALLVISVGTITLISLTGLLVFMLFFLAATVNAIVISLLMSLAAVGGFLALFFVCVTAVYIGALSVAVFVVSATTISAIIAVIIATGWIGFFWFIWSVTKKSIEVAQRSLNITGSAISAYSSGIQACRRHEPIKAD